MTNKKVKSQKPKVKSGNKTDTELKVVKAMLARALADYDNLSKRIEREREVLGKVSSIGVIVKLLPMLDNLENAQEHLQDAGLAICIEEFRKVLNEEGLSEIMPKVGDGFDENTMEAIEVVSGMEDNTVSEVVLKGWKFEDGQVIRHAKVKVSKIDN